MWLSWKCCLFVTRLSVDWLSARGREQLVWMPLMNQIAPLPEGGNYFCVFWSQSVTLFVTLGSVSFWPKYSCLPPASFNFSFSPLLSFMTVTPLHHILPILLFFISIPVPRSLHFPAPPSNPAFLGSKLWAFSPELFLPIYHSISSLSVCLWYSSLGLRHSLPCAYVSKREEVVKHFSSLLIVLTGPIGIPIRPIDFLALSALIFKFLIDPRSKSPAHSLTQSHCFSQGQEWDWEERRGKGERKEIAVR